MINGSVFLLVVAIVWVVVFSWLGSDTEHYEDVTRDDLHTPGMSGKI